MAESNRSQKIYPMTWRRERDLRLKGQWYISKELGGAVLMLGFSAVWSIGAGPACARIIRLTTAAWDPGRLGGEDPFQDLGSVAGLAGITALTLALPVLATALVLGVLTMRLQVGSLFSLDPVVPRVGRLNPGAGLKRMFLEPQTWRNGMLGLVKMLLMIALTGFTAWSSAPALLSSISRGAGAAAAICERVLTGYFWETSALYLLCGIADYFLQRASFRKTNQMTREELIEESREEDGLPEAKHRMTAERAAMLRWRPER